MLETEALPDKPSALIRVALDDLGVIENSPEYRVDMRVWHYPVEDNEGEFTGVCEVCLAGAVMARLSGFNPALDLTPHPACGYSLDLTNKLLALDWFRAGQIDEGLLRMGRTDHDEAFVHYLFQEVCDGGWTRYESDRDAWFEQMNRLADVLERTGY